MHFAHTLANLVVPTPEQHCAAGELLFTPVPNGVTLEWQPLTQYPDPQQSFVRISSRGQVLYHIRLGVFLGYDSYRTVVQDEEQLCLAFMEWQQLYQAVNVQIQALAQAEVSKP